MDKLTAETITDDQIRQLRDEATQSGDHKMANVCTSALGTDKAGYPVFVAPSGAAAMRKICAEEINSARAKDD